MQAQIEQIAGNIYRHAGDAHEGRGERRIINFFFREGHGLGVRVKFFELFFPALAQVVVAGFLGQRDGFWQQIFGEISWSFGGGNGLGV